MKKGYKIFVGLLLAIILVFIIWKSNNFLRKDNFELGDDEYDYYEFSIYYYARLFNHALLFNPLPQIDHKAPLVSLMSAITYNFVPINEDNSRIGNYIFIAISLLLLSLIEFKINKSAYSPFIWLMMPTTLYWGVRYYWPMVAVTASLLFLLFLLTRDKINPYLVGLALGLGILAKPTFFAFLLYPMLYYTIKEYKRAGLKHLVVSLLKIIIIVFLVAGWWYIPHLESIIYVYSNNVWGEFVAENEVTSKLFSLHHFLYYVYVIMDEIPWEIYGSALFFALFFLFSKKNENERLIVLSFIIPFLIFSLIIFRKDERYIVPLLSLIPLIVALAIRIKRPKLKYEVTFLFFILALLSINNLFADERYFHIYNNPRGELVSLISDYHPKHIILYSFYPRIRWVFREMNILQKTNLTITDCVFGMPDAPECSKKMNNSLILFTRNPIFCVNPVLKATKDFCDAYGKNIKNFDRLYGNLKPIKNLHFYSYGDLRNISIVVT